MGCANGEKLGQQSTALAGYFAALHGRK